MNIGGTSTTISLRAVGIDQLQQRIVDALEDKGYKVKLENKSDNELMLEVKNRGKKTLLSVTRPRHRPLEVEIEVDHTKVEPAVRKQKQSKNRKNQSNFNYRWIWLLLILGGLLYSTVEFLLGSLVDANIDFFNEYSLFEQISIVGLIFGGVLIFALYGIPRIQKWRDQSKKEFDNTILELIKKEIRQLDQELNTTSVIRCWSCFKEIDREDNVCPYCGKVQK